MILGLVLNGIRCGKARFVCAVSGVAASAFAVVFAFSLVATVDAQAPARARRVSEPWAAWRIDGMPAKRMSLDVPVPTLAPFTDHDIVADLEMPLLFLTIDYRPGGHVLQGPPMMTVAAEAPDKSPYSAVPLVEGRWVDNCSAEPEVVCIRGTFKRFGCGEGARIGEIVKFVGREGTMDARLVGYMEDVMLPRGFPDSFFNSAAFSSFGAERRGRILFWRTEVASPEVLTPSSESVLAAFRTDDQKRMDYARPVMLIAAVLVALVFLVNSLLLSIEANKQSLAVMRTVGLTRGGVFAFVVVESIVFALTGLAIGEFSAVAAIKTYVAVFADEFPCGAALNLKAMSVVAIAAVLVSLAADVLAVGAVMTVRAMGAPASCRCRYGMVVAFAFGFSSFVAVEVWGASLMRGFVPSAEWPDAIVSLLPSGVSSFSIDGLRGLEGVRRISELYPLQLDFPEEPGLKRRGHPNALFLAGEWLPEFRFVEGTHAECEKAMAEDGACVISLMISNARNLHKGDELSVIIGGPGAQCEAKLPIVGVVDVNWHMVTSRGLVRGLNGSSPMTDGPVFVSLDTIESLDARLSPMVSMTHLWVEYEEEFLSRHGVFESGRLVEGAISEALGNPKSCTVRLHARDEIADGTIAHGSDLIGQVARIPFFFLAILAIGFTAMLVAEADAKRRELAMLRAIGATRLQLTVRLATVALKCALSGIAIGLPVGAFAGWCFAIGTTSAWPGMPHYFELPWDIVTEGAIGAVAFAMVVALPMSIRLTKISVR